MNIEICEVESCENEVLITTKLKDRKTKFCRDCVMDMWRLITNQVFSHDIELVK